jgi:hypothetical protein
MKNICLILAALAMALAAGCGGDAKATAEDKANVDRLTKQGMTPQSSGQAGNEAGTPLSGKVEDP